MKVSFKGYVSITCVSGSYGFDASRILESSTFDWPNEGYDSILRVCGEGISGTHWNPDIGDNETDNPFSFSIFIKVKEQAQKIQELINCAQQQEDQSFEIQLSDEGLLDTVKDTRRNKILIKDGRLNTFC